MSTNSAPESRTWTRHPILRFFGSLKLAMMLLAVLILACIVGTVAESRLDAKVAQTYIYDAPWFFAWLLLLCANLAGAVLVRYPWKPHQTGFIITHAGIIVMLAGAMVGRMSGVEGSITLHKDQAPGDFLVLDKVQLELQTGQITKQMVVDLDVRPPSPRHPVQFAIGRLHGKVLDASQNLTAYTVVETNQPTDGAPALHVVLRSAMIPDPIEQWLGLGDPRYNTAAFGPGQLRFQEGPPAADTDLADAKAPAPQISRERHFVFGRMPEMTMARLISGSASGAKILLETAADPNEFPRLKLEVGGQKFDFPVNELQGRSTPLPGTTWALQSLRYLPDFRMQEKEAVSASNEPKNPAVVFELAGLAAKGTGHHDGCNHETGKCEENKGACCPAGGAEESSKGAHSHAAGSGPLRAGVLFYYTSKGKLAYTTYSKGKEAQQGEVTPGETVQTGLADWSFVVTQVAERAAFRQSYRPSSTGEGTRGVLLQWNEGEASGAPEWIPLGRTRRLQAAGEAVQVSLGYRIAPLPFSVRLNDFEVERDEGSSTPAGFKSHVEFLPEKSSSAPALKREVWMNHPASFPNDLMGRVLGTSYKFSQASWNPDDLSQTTLQVLRDPGWSLKWIGSLLLCGGLFTMFYLKPYPKKATANL